MPLGDELIKTVVAAEIHVDDTKSEPATDDEQSAHSKHLIGADEQQRAT